MMHFARIDNGRVAEVMEVADQAELAKRYHPDLVAQMVAADETVTPGMTWDGQAFAPYEPPPLTAEQLQARALAAAENAAPRPTVAASASQQTFHAILRVVAPLAQGEPPAQADIDHLAALAAKFAGATSNLPDADAESYVAAALAKADAAMDVYTKGGE